MKWARLKSRQSRLVWRNLGSHFMKLTKASSVVGTVCRAAFGGFQNQFAHAIQPKSTCLLSCRWSSQSARSMEAPTQLPISPSTHPCNSRTYRPTYHLPPTYLPTCLPTYLPTCLPAYLPTCLPAYLPACLPENLPTYRPTYLPTHPLGYLLFYPASSLRVTGLPACRYGNANADTPTPMHAHACAY